MLFVENEKYVDRKDLYGKFKIKLPNLIYISIFSLFLILFEYILRKNLKRVNLLFGTSNKENCKYFQYFEFYEYYGRYLLLFIVFNLVNTYSALCFMFLDCFSVYLNGLIRFIYLDPRPFWENTQLYPCFCAVDYGNPSTTGINLFILFATFYKCLTHKLNNNFLKLFFIFLGIFIVVYTSVIRVFQNIHYIHQLVYGYGIGYIIYYVFFNICDINIESKSQFDFILNNPIWTTVILSTLYLLSNLVHVILNLTPPLEFIDTISKNCKVNPLFAFDKESYTKSTRIFEFLGYFYGILLEYFLIFKQKKILFYRYNVKSKYEKFNDTDSIRTIIRIVFMYFGHIYFISNLVISKYNQPVQESIVYSLIVRLIIPYLIEGIFNFFIVKEIMKIAGLTNEIIHLPQVKPDKVDNLILHQQLIDKDREDHTN